MKNLSFLAVRRYLLIALLLIFTGACAFMLAEDVFQKTATDQASIKKAVIQAALNGVMPDYQPYTISNYTKVRLALKALAFNDRTAVVNDMGAFIKSYYNSPEFKTDFDAAVAQYKPTAEFHDSAYYQAQYERSVKLTNDAYEQYKKQYTTENIQNTTDKSFGNANSAMDMAQQYLLAHPEMAAAQGVNVAEAMKKMQEAKAKMGEKQQEANAEVAKTFTPDKVAKDRAEMEKKYQENMAKLKEDLQYNLAQVPANRKRYNDQVAELKAKANYKSNLSASLQKFLKETDGVDFSAQTSGTSQNAQLFVNADYEKKNAAWKQCFRAGKEATAAARSFAQQWLTELK